MAVDVIKLDQFAIKGPQLYQSKKVLNQILSEYQKEHGQSLG